MRTLELSLKKGNLIENGKIDENGNELSKGSNKILITVHNVNNPLESSISTRDAEFKDNEEYIFMNEYDDEPYLTTIFRGNVFEEFYIEIEITSVVKSTKAAKFFYNILTGFTEGAIKIMPGGDIVTSVTKVIGSSVFELIQPEDKIQILARGVVKIDTNDLPNDIEIPLTTPKKIKLRKVTYEPRIGQQKRKDKAIRKLHELELEQGFNNGFITLNCKEL